MYTLLLSSLYALTLAAPSLARPQLPGPSLESTAAQNAAASPQTAADSTLPADNSIQPAAISPFIPGPFSTDGRWMVNAKGDRLTMAGVNWPGAGEAMVPEGLQYASIKDIVTKLKSIGMNTIRLTWAVELVDDIIDGKGDVDIKTSFTNALGVQNGTKVYNAVMASNTDFAPGITRLEVFDAVAKECAAQNIYVHLDNHVSKAGWCCKERDGNAFFGDTNFDPVKWQRALGYMAEHGKTWTTLVSMALRNELRQASYKDYTWTAWLGNMTEGAAAISKANPDLLIYFGGEDFGTKLRPVFAKDPPATKRGFLKQSQAPIPFNQPKYPYADKIVLEMHDYNMDGSVTDCPAHQALLQTNAFQALGTPSTILPTSYPVVVSEWGFGQSPDQYQTVYASCLREYLPQQQVSWMTWVLGGGYYIREGKQDVDEPWGLLDHEWKDWRCPECITKGLQPMVEATLAGPK